MAKKAYIGAGNFIPRALPSGYTQVEHLKSTGTQYIDTGFVPNQDTRVVCEAIVPIGGTNWLYGARSSATSNTFGFAASTNGYYTAGYNTKTNSFDASLNSDGVIYIDANKSSTTLTSKNGTATINGTSGTFTAPCNLTLFGGNTKGTVTCGSVTIYSCKIYNNGTLVRDYVPCANNAGTAGLYDMANGVFYQNAGTGTFTAGTSVYTSAARKIKKGYVGVLTDIPIYEEAVVTVEINHDNVTDMFDVVYGEYSFEPYANNNRTWYTNNKYKSNSTATTILTAKYDMSVSFTYSYSSEANYDKFTLKVAGTTVENAVSGSTKIKTYSGNLKAGQSIEFTYAKDGSQDKYNDECSFSDMNVVANAKIQVGFEAKSVARQIKKAYIGIGGVARPCWSAGELTYYGTITGLEYVDSEHAAASTENHALFGGSSVTAYDKKLTRSVPSALSQARWKLAATHHNGSVLFGGGEHSSNLNYSKFVDRYDSSLTRSTLTSLTERATYCAATSVGNYALFGGGDDNDASPYTNVVNAYDNSFTKSNPASLNVARSELKATTVGNYALFAGGYGGNGYNLDVDVYDMSLTKRSMLELSDYMIGHAATTVGKYALFGGGNNQTGKRTLVNAFNESLTRTTPTGLNVARTNVTATTVDGFAIFGGGQLNTGYDNSDAVDIYDESLTRTIGHGLSVKRNSLAATSIGNYALFGGGYTDSDGDSKVVDVFVIA